MPLKQRQQQASATPVKVPEEVEATDEVVRRR